MSLSELFSAIKARLSRQSKATKSLEEIIKDLENKVGNNKDLAILRGFSSFTKKTIAEILVPRADISVISAAATLEELSLLINNTNHTRTLVYEGEHDNVIGFVHIKDLYRVVSTGQNFVLKDLLRQPLSLPPSMKLLDALAAIQKEHVHIALVIDEYGSVDGIITIEDIVESLFGPIEDEHDQASIQYEVLDDHTVQAHARTKISDLEKAMGLTLKMPDEECETIGGLVLARSGHMVRVGAKVKLNNIVEAQVVDANLRSLKQIKLIVLQHSSKVQAELENEDII